MKRAIKDIRLCLLAIITILSVSCEREKLSDVMVNEDARKVSLSLESKIEIGSGSAYTLDNNGLTVPVTINFDAASSKAFSLKVSVNTDTVASLVASNVLPAGTLTFEDKTYRIPPVINVAYGVKSVTFDLVISRTALEKSYGKNMALVLKMVDSQKGNSISPAKSATIVVINTGAIIATNEVHYVTFAPGFANRLDLPAAGSSPGFSKGSLDISIPLSIALSGEAGPSFTVSLAKDPQLVTTAIADGTLPANTIAVDDANYDIPNPGVTFGLGKNNAEGIVTVRVNALIFQTQKKLAIGIKLYNPSKYQLGKADTSVIVVIDPDNYGKISYSDPLGRRPFNGTPFLIKGTVNAVSDMIPASNYDFGGEGLAFHDSGNRDGGQFRRPDQVDIADNNIVVGWNDTGEWLTYTVNVEADGVYELNTMIGSPDDPGRYSIEFDGVKITPITQTRQTPGAYGDQQPSLNTVQLKQGIHVMRFYMDYGRYDVRGWIFTRKS